MRPPGVGATSSVNPSTCAAESGKQPGVGGRDAVNSQPSQPLDRGALVHGPGVQHSAPVEHVLDQPTVDEPVLSHQRVPAAALEPAEHLLAPIVPAAAEAG